MRVLPFALVLLAAAPPAAAQNRPTAAAAAGEHPRAVQLQMLEYQRQFLHKMADSMPERLYRDKATPAQRDFAQQIHHAAMGAVFMLTQAFKDSMPALPDTAATLNSRAGLKRYIDASFDYAANLLKGQSAATRTAPVTLFGKTMPGWQIWDEMHTHTVWTVGQVVANFRKHGMAPPAFTLF